MFPYAYADSLLKKTRPPSIANMLSIINSSMSMISVSENQSVLLQNKILMHLYIASCMTKNMSANIGVSE